MTLLHELAHLYTYEQYKGKVAPHGAEWKAIFSNILKDYLAKQIFPNDIAAAISQSIKNPGASTCADIPLQRALKKYDEKLEGMLMIEELALGQSFILADGRIFERGLKQRTRYKCKEVKTNKVYLFNKIYEVALLRTK